MLSPADMIILGAAALLFFGPDQLPKVARRAGHVMRDIQTTSQSFIREMERAADDAEIKEAAKVDPVPYTPPPAYAAPPVYEASGTGTGAPPNETQAPTWYPPEATLSGQPIPPGEAMHYGATPSGDVTHPSEPTLSGEATHPSEATHSGAVTQPSAPTRSSEATQSAEAVTHEISAAPLEVPRVVPPPDRPGGAL